jgi:hypothetical protein
MARLPQPGQDKGTWGDILNDFLSTSHNTDGSLKSGIVSNSTLDTQTQASIASIASKANTSDLAAKANISDLSAVATSGSYADLQNKPTIPTKPSDIGAVSTADVASAISTQATTDAGQHLLIE